jgi:hypothetical protein
MFLGCDSGLHRTKRSNCTLPSSLFRKSLFPTFARPAHPVHWLSLQSGAYERS